MEAFPFTKSQKALGLMPSCLIVVHLEREEPRTRWRCIWGSYFCLGLFYVLSCYLGWNALYFLLYSFLFLSRVMWGCISILKRFTCNPLPFFPLSIKFHSTDQKRKKKGKTSFVWWSLSHGQSATCGVRITVWVETLCLGNKRRLCFSI